MDEQMDRVNALLNAYKQYQDSIGGPWIEDAGLLPNILADLICKYGADNVTTALHNVTSTK